MPAAAEVIAAEFTWNYGSNNDAAEFTSKQKLRLMKATVGQELLDDDLGLVQMVGEGETAGTFVVKNLEGGGNDVVRNASVLAVLPRDAESDDDAEP
eukprot:2451098-Pleurochrysis_carterae.AAC.1